MKFDELEICGMSVFLVCDTVCDILGIDSADEFTITKARELYVNHILDADENQDIEPFHQLILSRWNKAAHVHHLPKAEPGEYYQLQFPDFLTFTIVTSEKYSDE